ncbi:CBS domain-containing protein [Corynebacterium sp. 335C]
MDDDAGTRPGDRARTFLDHYARIEAILVKRVPTEHWTGAVKRAERLHDRHGMTRHQLDAFKAFAELRNALSHAAYRDGRPIADPLPEAVAAIAKLAEDLDSPPTVFDVLEHRHPVTLAPDDDVRRMLRTLHERPHAQFPVYEDGRGIAMLTTDAIARWVAEDVTTDGEIGARTVCDVLAHVAGDAEPVFVARLAPITEIIHLLSQSDDPRRPGAVIVTEHGRADNRPLRVVAMGDLPALYAALDGPGA